MAIGSSWGAPLQQFKFGEVQVEINHHIVGFFRRIEIQQRADLLS